MVNMFLEPNLRDEIYKIDAYRPLFQETIAALDHNSHAPSEYIAAMKLATRRTRDVANLETLLADGVVDVQRARVIIAKYLGVYAARKFDDIVEMVSWKKSKGTF